MNPQSHRSDPRILGRRTLHRDHRRLATLLRPVLAVLDVGCGTGAITAGIAKAVGRGGRVIGVDRDEELLAIARREHSAISNLQFESGDATSLAYEAQFDIVTAARTLQWIADPRLAILNMKRASKRGGLLVVLDYAHNGNEWNPEPPPAFRRFYDGLLAWRQSNHWDNEMADHLPELFQSAGLIDIESQVQDEAVQRGDADFAERTALWSEVIDSLSEQLTKSGHLTDSDVQQARDAYVPWVETELMNQRLAMRTVTGRVP